MDDDHDMHYDSNYFGVEAAFMGGSDAFLKLFSMASKILIIVQGIMGAQAASKNKSSDIARLIKVSIYLTIAQLVIIGVSMFVAAIFIEELNDE